MLNYFKLSDVKSWDYKGKKIEVVVNKLYMNLPKVMPKMSRRRKCLIIMMTMLITILCDIFGLLLHFFEKEFHAEFEYPLNYKNFTDIVNLHKRGIGHKYIQPINPIVHKFSIQNELKCRLRRGAQTVREEFEPMDILLVIKSAVNNFGKRDSIRKTWGKASYWNSLKMKKIFMLASCSQGEPENECHKKVKKEAAQFDDIVQANFIDGYYNNTIKTRMSLKWVVDYCPDAKFAFFVDDDYFLSPKNLMKLMNTFRNQINTDYPLYVGKSFTLARPIREKYSKWFISLSEYPYNEYPPFVNAGAFLLSKAALLDLHYGSLYTKHFTFDDIFLAIVAKKMAIDILNNAHFYNSREQVPKDLSNTVAAHGFTPKELLELPNSLFR